jgi:hypothetical protein
VNILAVYLSVGLWLSGYSYAATEDIPARRSTTVVLALFTVAAWPIVLVAGAIGSALEQP